MDENYKPLRAVFNEAVEIKDPAERAAYLDQACGQDAVLRRKIDDLLRAHEEAGGFLGEQEGGAATLPITEKAGDRIGRYKLVEKIGEGGCGIVYLAEQEEPLRRRVALKVIRLGMDTQSVIARFEAERQALALMDHPNIARVFDAGATDGGRPYFVMELVRGVRITEYCDENALSAPERLALFVQVCQAIQHAHQKGIIHRDIKPSNILVTVNDGVAVPKVIDFGIAKATEQKLTEKTVRTLFLEFLGTPAYMSPEQAAMTTLDIDTRSDIYSLGVLLYELLAGQPPFDGPKLLQAGFDAMRRTIAEAEPARPSTRLRQMPFAEQTTTAQRRRTEPPKLIKLLRGDLDWIVMKCLEKDRARRYETANALAADIQRHLDTEPVLARPPSNIYRVQKLLRRHRKAFAAAAALLVILAAGLAASTWFFVRESAARQIVGLRNAELASRSGRWRDALKFWDAAERAGYKDSIDLGLKRAEAWIVLADKPRAKTEFDKVMRLSDLGARRGSVLLRVGEFEMFNRATFEQGVQHVRQALTNGLDAADTALANGLIADSTPAALGFFNTALEHNPFLHSAHRHSLGLKFVLGRHDELAAHLRVAKVLYPGDFSPGQLEIMELALHGRTNEAQSALSRLRAGLPPDSYRTVERGIRLLSRAAAFFEPEAYLGGQGSNAVAQSELLTNALESLQARGSARPAGPLPQLPCVEQGIQLGFDGLKMLAIAKLLGGTDAAIEKIRDSSRHHPEALFPFFAGTFLDKQQPRTGPRDLRLLALQSEMYQKAADSPSILPSLPRLARVLAADVQEELALSKHTNAAAFRTNCQANLRRAALEPQLAPIECGAYARWSYALNEYDLDRQFLARWESLRPEDPSLLRNRIRLEMASGAYGPALKHIDRALAANPDDKFAKAEREKALQEIKKLSDSALGTKP